MTDAALMRGRIGSRYEGEGRSEVGEQSLIR